MAYTFLDTLQPVLRLGFFDEDIDSSNNSTVHYDAGLNYYIKGHSAKLQSSYTWFDWSAGGADRGHRAIVSAQVSF